MLRKFTKPERAWIMYDWANSAQSSIIVAILLPILYKNIAVASGLDKTLATSYWGYASSLASLLVALAAPVLGTLGDYMGLRKRMFAGFLWVGVVATALLTFAPGWISILVLFALSCVGFYGANIYYDSMLVDVTTHERMDLVSTAGYSFGYIGGSTIPLVIALALYATASLWGPLFSLEAEAARNLAMRFSCLLTALWWAWYSRPILQDVEQLHGAPRDGLSAGALIRGSFASLRETFRNIRPYKALFAFLLAYFFYIDGVGTIIHMATVFGDDMGINQLGMMSVLLVVQLVAFPCAYLYGMLAKRFSTRTMILVGIATYIVVCLVGFTLRSLLDFLILGFLVGTAQGGIQALSRSYFGKLVPPEHANEFFGFFDIFGKFSSVMGPALFGLAIQLASQAGLDGASASRWGILSVVIMFIIGGGIFLAAVPPEKKPGSR